MDKQNLSKCKYVWIVYRGERDGSVHKEKYPVIYANNIVTYYKVGRGMDLSKITTSYIKDAPTQNDIKDILRYRQKKFYWDIPDSISALFLAIKDAVDKEREQKYIEETVRKYRAATFEYERAKKAYDKLPDEVKNEKEVCKTAAKDPIEFWRNG